MFTDDYVLNIVIGGTIGLFLVLIYLLFDFVISLKDNDINTKYESYAKIRHNDLIDEFIKNKIDR